MCKQVAPFLLTVLAVVVGCNAPADTRLLEPFIAVAGQYTMMACPAGPPVPVVGDVCPACFGRGIVLMDGKTATKCQACDGTGKKKTAAVTPGCKDGSCPTPKSTVR